MADQLFHMGSQADVIDVRDAVHEDLPGVAAIYTHYTLRTTITFNTNVRSPAEWRTRFDERVAHGFPFLVAIVDGQVAGYVEAGQFRSHSGYAKTCEVSIYLAPDSAGRGVGSALYRTMFARLHDAGFHRAIAVVALPNDASCRFHERHGFVRRGTLHQVGFKFNQWLDTAYYERDLS